MCVYGFLYALLISIVHKLNVDNFSLGVAQIVHELFYGLLNS